MSKRIEVNLVDPDFDMMTAVQDYPLLYSIDCNNILDQFEGKEITNDDALKAIDTLAAYFYQEKLYKMVMDIDERDRYLAPAKEMTIEDIENRLGHKIKIVSKKEKNG